MSGNHAFKRCIEEAYDGNVKRLYRLAAGAAPSERATFEHGAKIQLAVGDGDFGHLQPLRSPKQPDFKAL